MKDIYQSAISDTTIPEAATRRRGRIVNAPEFHFGSFLIYKNTALVFSDELSCQRLKL